MTCEKCGSEKTYKNTEKYSQGLYKKELCLECGHIKHKSIHNRKKWSVAYSKTNKDHLLVDGHFYDNIGRCDLEKITVILNEKEKEIENLKLKIVQLEENQ